MAHDVFISYSSQDKAVADAVCASLEARKVRCWIAPRDVLPGIPYGEAIIDGINGSRVLVLVFSTNSNNSPQVMREIERAVHKGIPIIPLRIDEVIPTKAMEYFVSAAHWLDALTPPLEKHLQKLGETIQVILSNETSEAPTAEPKPAVTIPVQQRSRLKNAKLLSIAIVSILVIVIVIVGVKVTFKGKSISSNTAAQNTGTMTSTSVVTSAPTISVSSNSQILFQDDFSDSTSGWQQYSDTTRDTSYVNGEYSLTLKKENYSYWCINKNAGQLKDFVFDVDARLFSGSNKTFYGIVFRLSLDTSDFYCFTVSEEGNCIMRKRVNGSWISLENWSQLSYINSNGTYNHIKAIIKNNQFDLYINDKFLTSIVDTQFAQGYIGIIVVTNTAPACAHFDNVKISSIN